MFRIAKMPFCAPYVQYPACLPQPQLIPPLRDFPRGRWFNHTTDKKDMWISEQATAHIAYREGLEQNETLIATARNEFGEAGTITLRFTKKPDCVNAFQAFFCYANFPRCDLTTGQTLPMCKSACENFFTACGYETTLWRCGRSKFFNGYAPEPQQGQDVNGTPIYFRDYFPGQPFRQNKFDKSYLPVAVCTPSIFGAAPQSNSNMGFLKLSLLLLFIIFSSTVVAA